LLLLLLFCRQIQQPFCRWQVPSNSGERNTSVIGGIGDQDNREKFLLFSNSVGTFTINTIQEYLSKKESKISAVKEGKAQLSESDYIETLDLCCSQSWEIYGVMEVNGVKRLSGPGLETEEHPGVMMTSGPWPARLYKMCQAYLGELTEEEIYQEFRNNRDYLEDFLCYDKNGTCTKLGNTIWIPQKEEF
uniref:Uncharacterized protein n=1 Tax=Callorhinchus milii TaxID=7868 RepID=A0A4W3HG48_CALMI